jgi:hypothetical protein
MASKRRSRLPRRKETDLNKIPPQSKTIAWGLLAAALFLVLLYFVIAWAQGYFQLDNFDYFNAFLYNIPDIFIRSQFWKILLLLPATILISVFLSRAGIRFRVPKRLNNRVAVGLMLLTATVVLILSTELIFRETEVTDDENTYDFQARTLVLGRVVNPPPPVRQSFTNNFIINDGRHWVGKYTLGHPLVIAIGIVLGNRYIVTIAISILTLLLLYLIGVELYGDKKISFLALGLGIVSPFFYCVSSSRLSHTTAAFFLTLFMYLFLRARRAKGVQSGVIFSLLSGLALGYAFNVRSLTALGFALPFGFLLIADIYRRRTAVFLKAAMLTAGFTVMFVLTAWYNLIVTGHFLRFPFHYYNINENLGFGVQGHTIFLALRNLVINIARLNSVFLGFPLSLLFLFLAIFSRKEFGDRLLFGILGGIAVLHLFYFSPGVADLGPVYYYEMLIPLLLLTSRGIVFAHRVVAGRFEKGGALVPSFIVLSCFFAFITFVPEQVLHITRLTQQIREPYEAVNAAKVHRAVVMIKSRPIKGWVFGYRNPSPGFDDDVLFCVYADQGSNLAVANHFADRKLYVLDYNDSLNRYEVFPVTRQMLQKTPGGG